MRTRLSIRLLALGLLLCQLQSAPVQAQRYYMNFAFNNNQPNSGVSDTNEQPDQELASSGNADDSPTGSLLDSSEATREIDDSVGIGAGAVVGDPVSDSNESVPYDVSDGEDEENELENGGGGDDDDDDSDSHDTIDRRNKLAAAADFGNRPANDHSHHSSYEISIDDSFGGRYVRSIYESSESHGHSGSNPYSGSFDERDDSSNSKEAVDHSNVAMYGSKDYEEPNDDF